MLRRDLVRAGFLMHEAASAAQAMRSASETSPDIVILDRALSDGEGAEVCRRIREIPRSATRPSSCSRRVTRSPPR